MKDGCVPKEAHVEKPTKAELRPPEPTMEGPTTFGQCGRVPALAHLHHSDAVALLDEAMGANAAPEAGADHNEVKVEFVAFIGHPLSLNRIHLLIAFQES